MLNENNIFDYWNKRSEQQQERTVGFSNWSIEKQDKVYEEVFNFVIPKINTKLKTLDYGCGTGRWCGFFDDYLGADITQKLLEIAKKNNPEKEFKQLETPYLNENIGKFDLIFTSTVLQHNDDPLVINILKSFKNNLKEDSQIILYENTHKSPNAPHMAFRSTNDYKQIISDLFLIKKYEEFEFNPSFNQPHSLMIFNIKNP